MTSACSMGAVWVLSVTPLGPALAFNNVRPGVVGGPAGGRLRAVSSVGCSDLGREAD